MHCLAGNNYDFFVWLRHVRLSKSAFLLLWLSIFRVSPSGRDQVQIRWAFSSHRGSCGRSWSRTKSIRFRLETLNYLALFSPQAVSSWSTALLGCICGEQNSDLISGKLFMFNAVDILLLFLQQDPMSALWLHNCSSRVEVIKSTQQHQKKLSSSSKPWNVGVVCFTIKFAV